MNRTLCTFALFAVLPLAAVAAEPPKQAPAPPPPDMDAPAVKAAPVEKAAAGEAKVTEQAATDANGEPAPAVTVRKQGDDTVEEYRRDGRITMIRITGKGGVAQTYIANSDGKLVRDARQGPVDPVYFTVYQWK